MSDHPVYKLEIFCPEENVDELLEVLASQHAGEIGNYDHCTTISQVQGTYRPLLGATPAVGEVGKLIRGSECKIEVNCKEEFIAKVIQAVHKAHPYEEPVINVFPLANSRFGGTA